MRCVPYALPFVIRASSGSRGQKPDAGQDPGEELPRDGRLRLLAALDRAIERADKLVGKVRAGSKEAMLLETIPGVGPILALTILAEIGDVGRFHPAKHLSSYAGLVPSTRQSGELAMHGHITKQ